MSQMFFWVYCNDCRVYMELGNYLHKEGHFQGPTPLHGENPPHSDWGLRRFLEAHDGHRMGLIFDAEESIERSMIQEGWQKTVPETQFCMVFKTEEDRLKELDPPHSLIRPKPSEQRVAVSVLTLHRPWFLLQCLTALMQNDTEFTLFLTNQGDTTFGTNMICDWWKNQPYVKYIYNKPPLFPGAARAKVFQMAHDMGFEYIITVDDDSFLHPHAIDKLVETADEHPEYHAISGFFIGRREKYLLGGKRAHGTLKHRNFTWSPGVQRAEYISNGFRLIRLNPLVLPDTKYEVGYTDWDYANQLREKKLRMAVTGDAGGWHKHMRFKKEMVIAQNPLAYKVRNRERTARMRKYFMGKWGYDPV